MIIGVQKAGSTSLYDLVIQHPAIAPASKKEINYFQRPCYYKYSKLWYRSHFPTKLSRSWFYKKTNQKLLTGEASIHYIFSPLAPRRMKEALPDAKLILILRNPIDRAYSHYRMKLRVKKEALPFEKAIELEEERCAGERERIIKDPDFVPIHYKDHSYLARGLYADQLENWFKHYDRKQFLILTTENLRDNRQRTLNQVFDFLQVPPFQIENLRNLNVANYQAMNEDTRKFLVKYYRPHNEKLAKLLRRDFDWDR